MEKGIKKNKRNNLTLSFTHANINLLFSTNKVYLIINLRFVNSAAIGKLNSLFVKWTNDDKKRWPKKTRKWNKKICCLLKKIFSLQMQIFFNKFKTNKLHPSGWSFSILIIIFHFLLHFARKQKPGTCKNMVQYRT